MTIVLDGTTGISTPGEAVAGNLSYTGTLTGGTGVVNIGSGQVYKDASGNVGIGTTSPAALLDVAGLGRFSKGSGGGVTIGDVTTNSNSVLRMQGTSAGKNWQIANNLNVGGLEFTPSTANGGTTFTTPAVVIDSSGNLLVGTTTSRGLFTAEANGVSASIITTNATASSGTRYHATWRETAVERGSITSAGGGVAYNSASDYRLKDAIVPMTNALARVAALKPVTYTWKNSGAAGEGFIAHELQEVCPIAVTREKDAVDAEGNPQYQGIDTSFLVATLAAAIQELKAIVDTQAISITALNERLTALEAANV